MHKTNIFYKCHCKPSQTTIATTMTPTAIGTKNCRSFFIACGYGGENASNKSDELKGMKQIEEDFKCAFGTCYGH